MKTTLICIIWMILGSQTTNAQFKGFDPLLESVQIKDEYIGLQLLNDKIYALGRSNIYESQNDGQTWKTIPLSLNGKFALSIASDGKNVGLITSDDKNFSDFLYFSLSQDGGQTWNEQIFEFEYAYIDDESISLTIKDSIVVFTSLFDLYVSVDFGKNFKKSSFNGNSTQNRIYLINDLFYIVGHNYIRSSSNMKDFQSVYFSQSSKISNHFLYKNNIVVNDGGLLKVLEDNKLIPFEDFNIKKDFKRTESDNEKIYFHYDQEVVVIDLGTFKKDTFYNDTFINPNDEYPFVYYKNSKAYYNKGSKLYKKQLYIPSAPAIDISNTNPVIYTHIIDKSYFYAFDRLWYPGEYLYFKNIEFPYWQKTAISKSKFDLFGVVSKESVFVKNPLPSIYSTFGQKIRNSQLDIEVSRFFNCGDILIAQDVDGKLFALHNGIIPWFEIRTPIKWEAPLVSYSQNTYIMYEINKGIVTSPDGYVWTLLAGTIPETFISVRKLKNGSFIAASSKNIYIYDFSGQQWLSLDLQTFPVTNAKFAGLETYENIIIVSIYGHGVYTSSEDKIKWEDWNDGLTNKRIFNTFSSHKDIFVQTDSVMYQRPFSQLAGVSLTEFTDDKKFSVKVYPNPASDILFIQNDSSYDFRIIEILDLSGKVLLQGASTLSLDVSSLTNGAYVLRVIKDDKTYYQLFEKQH